MREVYDWVAAERDTAILPTLEMRDIEHSLCEVDKMSRIKDCKKHGGKHGIETYRRGLVDVL